MKNKNIILSTLVALMWVFLILTIANIKLFIDLEKNYLLSLYIIVCIGGSLLTEYIWKKYKK